MNQVQARSRPFRILIGTPAGYGNVSLQYMLSLLSVFQEVMAVKKNIFIRDNLRAAKLNGMINEQNLQVLNHLEAQNLFDLEIGLYTLSNESLLTRGRNHIAAVAIRQGWDRLMFIDADARFTYHQFIKVVTSVHDLTVGVCPLKVFPISLNYMPFKDDPYFLKNDMRSVNSLLALRDGHKSNYIPVAFAGTAFMSISRKLLLASAEIAGEYQYPNPSTGYLHTHWNMFATEPMDGKFMSEDWYFCKKARDLGFQVMIDSDVIISHVGSWVFSPEQAQVTYQTPLLDSNVKESGAFVDGASA